MIKLICSSLVVSLLAVAGMATEGTADYLQRISLALEEAKMIRGDPAYSTEGISNIKLMLPRREHLEVDGVDIEIENSWVHELLDSYAAASSGAERTQKLDELTERLRALESHLKRRDGPKAGGSDPRQQLKAILSRAEYKEKNEGPIAALVKKVKQKLLELIEEIVNGIRSRVGGSTTAGWILKGLIVVLISGALFLIVKAGFRKRPKKKAPAKVTVLGEEIDEGVTPADLTSAALTAAGAGDFRTAIRKLYIALLYEFNERGILELEPNATNREYMTKVSRFGVLAAPMGYMTDRFDYFWYGKYPSSRDDFSNYLEQYRDAVARVRSLATRPA